MDDVHGIAVAGGTFPAQIWHLFMQSAVGAQKPRDFPPPLEYPTFTYWHRGQYSLGYYGSSSTTTADTTTTTVHDRRAAGGRPGAGAAARGDRGAADADSGRAAAAGSDDDGHDGDASADAGPDTAVTSRR